MSRAATIKVSHRIGDKQYIEKRELSAEASQGRELSVPQAKVGALTTRTDNTIGELTMAASHGITTGARLDIYWDGGMRRGVAVGTVATNAVPISGGSGDNLPADETAITAMVPIEEALVVTGNNVEALLAYSSRKGQMVLEDSGGEELHIPLTAESVYAWHSASGVANPIAGDSITKIFLSHGDSGGSSTMRYDVLHD